MKKLIAFLTLGLAASALMAVDTPKNLLRFNMGALPMAKTAEGQWGHVTADSIDWNSPSAAILAGDVGKSVNLDGQKTFVIEMGQVESIERFSFFSESATGSVAIFTSPIFADPDTGKWTELGSMTLTPQQVATLTSVPTEARYLKLVFSPESKGMIGPMGAFGMLTYNDVHATDNPQANETQSKILTLNYATPATQLVPMGSSPAQKPEDVMALFDDDAATQMTVTAPTQVTVDLGANRSIDTLAISSSTGSNVSMKFGGSMEDLNSPTAPSGKTQGSSTKMQNPLSARFVQITLSPTAGKPVSINGLSLVGPVTPEALVFDRNADVGDVADRIVTPTSARPITRTPPRITSF